MSSEKQIQCSSTETPADILPQEPLNLLNYDRPKMREFFLHLGEKPYHADQLIQWIHDGGISNLEAMTNLSKSLRHALMNHTHIALPEVAFEKKSADGTIKWLFRLADGNSIETVYIPESNRGTLCVSSQVGCVLDCSFCSTGKQGFNRDLTTAEIIGQVWLAVRRLSKMGGRHDGQVTNVVMMGMGEPLLNYDNVLPAMNLMLDDFAYGLSKRRVTLSTSGVVPMMERLRDTSEVALAVSLHAPNDELRNELVPLNKKYPLDMLMAVCRTYFKSETKRKITFEYVMLHGVNDHPHHAKQLAKLLHGVPAKVNLIPFNPFPHTHYQRSTDEAIDAFARIVRGSGIVTTIRKTRGDDVDGACGQLVGQVKDRTRRSERWRKTVNVPISVIS